MAKKPHWKTSPNTFLSAILQAANNHGNDADPDMEIGDLQELVWDLWNMLSLDERTLLMSSEKWNSRIACWGCEFSAPPRRRSP